MFIQKFITPRITAEMQPLTLGQAIELCEIPDCFNEESISRALKHIVKVSNIPLENWTVQERYLAIGHYIAAQEKGDWEIADGALYSHYLLDNLTPEVEEFKFKIHDDNDETVNYKMSSLTGNMIEAVERFILSLTGKDGAKKGDWVLACMAIQIQEDSENALKLDELDDKTVLDEVIKQNYDRLLQTDEPFFNQLLSHYLIGLHAMAHCVKIAFLDDGLIVLPVAEEAGNKPARFRVDAMLGQGTTALWKTIN